MHRETLRANRTRVGRDRLTCGIKTSCEAVQRRRAATCPSIAPFESQMFASSSTYTHNLVTDCRNEAVKLTNLSRPNVSACSAWLTLLLAAEARVHSLVNRNTALLSGVTQSLATIEGRHLLSTTGERNLPHHRTRLFTRIAARTTVLHRNSQYYPPRWHRGGSPCNCCQTLVDLQ